jgi:phosphatidylglycerol:prolipoprotein diacylglycerol transferase
MNPIFANLGIIEIRWYSVTMFLAMFIGGCLLLAEAEKYEITEDTLINFLFWLIPISLIGARLYYVAFNWSYYSQNISEIFQVWKGGLAIHGGILFGLIYLISYTKKYNISTLRMLDIIVVSLLIGQAIGRWGNFFNSEAYGPVTTLGFLQGLHLPEFIINGMYINGAYHQPTFLYESLWCFIGFIVALVIRKKKYLKLGTLTSFYFVWYGIGRFFIEGMRTDSLMLGNFKMAQIVSLLMIVIGILMYFWANRGGVFERLYTPVANLSYSDIPDPKLKAQAEATIRQEELIAKHASTSTPKPEVRIPTQTIRSEQPTSNQPTQSSASQPTPKTDNNKDLGNFKW